jgi:hypothetical protein
MAQQKLDLLGFPSCLVAQPSTCPSEIMWSNRGESAARGSSFHNCPDNLSGEALSPDSPSFVLGTEKRAGGKLGRQEPTVHGQLDPVRYGDSAYVPAFSY